MIDAITEWLVAWFAKKNGMSNEEIRNQVADNYFERGWLDSFGFILFVTDIEQRFTIVFDNDDFQDRTFSSISGLAHIIEGKMDGDEV